MTELIRRKIVGNAWETAVDSGGGGGGGTAEIFVASKDISSAEILTMLASPVEIVPAPAADQAIIPLQVLFRYNHVTTNYTFGGDTFLYISTAAELASNNGGFYGATAQAAFLTSFNNGNLTMLHVYDDVIPMNVKGEALVVTTGSQAADGDGTVNITTWYALVTLP